MMDAVWVDAGRNRKVFIDWLTPKLRDKQVRNIVVDHLAWNDPNSDWNLQRDMVVRWGQIRTGPRAQEVEQVDARMVAESATNMLEYNNPKP